MIRSQTFGGRFRAWRAVGCGRRVGGGFRMARRERVRARLWEARLREARGDATMYRRRRWRKMPGVASGGTAAGGLLCGRLAHGWKCRRASPACGEGRDGRSAGQEQHERRGNRDFCKNGGKGAVVRTSVMRGRESVGAKGCPKTDGTATAVRKKIRKATQRRVRRKGGAANPLRGKSGQAERAGKVARCAGCAP